MAKSNPLKLGLEKAAAGAATPPAEPPAPRLATSKKQAEARAPARQGQILIGGFFAPEVHRQLKILAAESGVTQQELLAEALNTVFAKYGKPEIARLGRILEAA